MDERAARQAAHEMPEGTQILYGEFAERGAYYPCTYLPDVVYAQDGGIERRLQIITPSTEGNRFPLVVFVQGSAWHKQNLYMAIPSLSHLAAKGYVIASVEIRDTGIAPFPAALEDVKTAIRYMRAHAGSYGVDPARVAVWGDSSGGHLALMTGLTTGEYTTGQYPEQSDAVSAVVSYYGVTDLIRLGRYNSIVDHDAADSPEGLLIGGAVPEHQEAARKASPLHQDLDRPLPPFLLLHGDSDSVVHINQSIEMYKALRAHGHNAAFYKVMGAEHGIGCWHPRVLEVTEQFLSTWLHRPSWQAPPLQHEVANETASEEQA